MQPRKPRYNLLDLEDFGREAQSPKWDREQKSGYTASEIPVVKSAEISAEEQAGLQAQSDPVEHHREDIEAIRKQAFEEGMQKARETLQDETEKRCSTLFLSMKNGFDAAIEKRNHEVETLSRLFSETLVDCVSLLFDPAQERLETMREEIYNQAASFAAGQEGDIQIYCHEEEKEILYKILEPYDNIRLNISGECQKGMIRVETPSHHFVVESGAWKEKMKQRMAIMLEGLRKNDDR